MGPMFLSSKITYCYLRVYSGNSMSNGTFNPHFSKLDYSFTFTFSLVFKSLPMPSIEDAALPLIIFSGGSSCGWLEGAAYADPDPRRLPGSPSVTFLVSLEELV